MYFIEVSFYFYFIERQFSCCREKNMNFRVWLSSTLILLTPAPSFKGLKGCCED